MSIPRFAIHRPVMMAMISSIIILIGGISLSRLPVDLLPDISQPTVNVRVTYTGVGPLEMEDLIVPPLEQQLNGLTRTYMKRKLLDQLAAGHDFEVPPSMVEAEFDQIWHQLQHEAEHEADGET